VSNDTRKLIGVISDTHGLVRPQALDALAGVDLILHAGGYRKPASARHAESDRVRRRGEGKQ
jgi:predicted phosphodiesterase